MDKETLIELLTSAGHENSILFENPSYESAIIGYTDSGQVCYSFSKMVNYLIEKENMSDEDALDFISYNTIRALPYCSPAECAPIIVYDDIE